MCGLFLSFSRTLFSLSILLSLLSPLQLPLAAPPPTLHQRCPPPFFSKICVKSPVSCFVASNRVSPSVSATVGRAAAAAPSIVRVVSLLHHRVCPLLLPELEAASSFVCHSASSTVGISSFSASHLSSLSASVSCSSCC
ncbi:uncharacterized protein DS421_3g69190 [Arachis hypogaea]|nr:uncharacterized protein DS421_3g69190 [Arachis hypogaea]